MSDHQLFCAPAILLAVRHHEEEGAAVERVSYDKVKC